jgi:hypothetical protein
MLTLSSTLPLGTVNTKFQTAMEELFYKYGVDIYFCGHQHLYERQYPTYKGEIQQRSYDNPLATTHLVIGGAGGYY